VSSSYFSPELDYNLKLQVNGTFKINEESIPIYGVNSSICFTENENILIIDENSSFN